MEADEKCVPLRQLVLAACVTLSCAADSACLKNPDVAPQCRYPQGDGWCAENSPGEPYAYRDKCMDSSPSAGILSVPCFANGDGDWLFSGLPDSYFPVGLISVTEWPVRDAPDHELFDPYGNVDRYGTCVIVPASR